MLSIFTQKKTKSSNQRLKEKYKELNQAIGGLADELAELGVSEQHFVDTINDLDCMNQDLDDSCAAAAAAPATSAAAAAPDAFDDDDF